MLPHPARLRSIAPAFLNQLQRMLGTEWNLIQGLLRRDELILPEIIRRLAQPDGAPRFTMLVNESTGVPGGTEQGGPLGMVAFMRQEARPAPHFLLDDKLVAMLENTDIAPDVPMSMFNLPFQRLYLELGRKREIQTTIPNVLSGDHVLEGAYIERGKHADGEFLYIVMTGSPLGKSGPEDDATLSVALPLNEPERPIADVISTARRKSIDEASTQGLALSPDTWAPATVHAILLLVKALLYIGLPGTRRELHPERTTALKEAAGLKSTAKKAKAQKRADRVYDYIHIGPQPEHVAEVSGQPTDRAVKAHWRRGHYRLQAHGVQMTLRKLIFIQPVLVAGSAEVAASAVYKVS